MDKSIRNFINDNRNSHSNNQPESKIFFYWLLNIAFYFLGSNAIVWGIAVTVLNVIVTVLYFIKKKSLVFEDIKILGNGISDIYFALLFALLSYRLFSEQYLNNILILLVFIFVLCIIVCASWIVTYLLIKSGKYNPHQNKKTSSVLSVIIGMIFARYVFLNETIPHMLIAFIVFFLIAAFFAVKGGKNILKFLLINQLDESDKDSPPEH